MRFSSNLVVSLVIAVAASFQFTGCMTGEDPEPEDPEAAFCIPRAIDSNGDSTPDGMDNNCDGVVDVPFGGGTGTGGGGTGGGQTTTQSNCRKQTYENNQLLDIKCTSTNGGAATCECRINSQLVQTCTASTSPACAPDANCCGF
jgi:hypothetical protein